jgi:hypothetical protein
MSASTHPRPIPDSAQALADAVDTDATGTSDVAALDAARDSDADTAEPALRDSGADLAEPDLRDSGDDTPEPDLEQPECESRVWDIRSRTSYLELVESGCEVSLNTDRFLSA